MTARVGGNRAARRFVVYVMASASRTLYVGMTNDLQRRVYEHKRKLIPGFTAQYNVTRLVHAEEYPEPRSTFAREKQLKGWRREKKVALIEGSNPDWRDLNVEWYDR